MSEEIIKKSKKKASGKKTPRKKKVVAKKKRRSKKKVAAKPRLPISAMRAKGLGFRCEHLTAADEQTGLDVPLAELVDRHDALAAAWQRGQFLRNLEELAGSVMTVTQAAKRLGMAKGTDLREKLDTDTEARNLWDQARIRTICKAKRGMVTAAGEGNQAAIRAVEAFLRDEGEVAGPVVSFEQVGVSQLSTLFGVSRQAIHEWHTKRGLPRNGDGTFDLRVVIAWFEEDIRKKVAPTQGALSVEDSYRQEKREGVRLKNLQTKGELLDRTRVVQRFTLIYQSVLAELDRIVRDVGPLLANKSEMQIKDILTKERRVFVRKLKDIPTELNLPEAALEQYKVFFSVLAGDETPSEIKSEERAS